MPYNAYVKQGDTAPAIQQTLQDSTGAAVNLTGASVLFHMTTRAGVSKVNAAASIVAPATSGVVKYQWLAADTATPGFYYGEWAVTFADATIERFPNAEQINIFVTADLL